MINLAVAGHRGKMGREIVSLAAFDKGITALGLDKDGNWEIADVLIDFTSPSATMYHLGQCAAHQSPWSLVRQASIKTNWK
jgi:dihydrodipicolinate reductase